MGEILIDWEGHNKALATKLWEFFNEDYLVDFNVTCHGKQKKVHKFVLAFLFPILRESLRSSGSFCFDHQEPAMHVIPGQPLKIPEAQCLCLDNVADHAEDIEYLIQFAYTGKATVPSEHVDCLMRIAEAMEIQCLKDSLNGSYKIRSDRNDQLGRLRPRNHLKEVKVIEESVDLISSNDDDNDFDFHGVVGEESSLDSVECSDNSNKRTGQNRLSQKRRSEDVHFKEKKPIKLVIKQPSENLPKTGFNYGEPSNEQAFLPINDEGRKTAKCPQCDYTAPYPYLVVRHLKTHAKKEAKKINSAEQTTTTTSTNKVKEKKIIKCPQCYYTASYQHQIDRHLQSHARKLAKGPKQFSCKLCKETFESNKLLETHRDSKCGTEPLVCKYCGHETIRKFILLQHMSAIHQVDADGNPLEKNIKCPDCDFVCYADHQLRTHKRAKHERLGMFKCKECSFRAPYITQLVRHERTKHRNIRDYMCEECGYRYKSRGLLNRHVLIQHKGVKPHKCNICNAEYSNRLSFKVHMQRHEGKVEYKFVCHICGHNLRRKFELRIHMKKKHGIEMEELAITDDLDPCQSEDTSKPTS